MKVILAVVLGYVIGGWVIGGLLHVIFSNESSPSSWGIKMYSRVGQIIGIIIAAIILKTT